MVRSFGLALVVVVTSGASARSQPLAPTPAATAPCRPGTAPYLEATAWLGASNASYGYGRTRVESAFRVSAGALRDRCGGLSYRIGLALGGFLALGGSPEASGLGQVVLGPELEVTFLSSGAWRFGVTAAAEISTDYANGFGATSVRLGLRARRGALVLGLDGIHSTGAGDAPGSVTGAMFGVGATGKPGAVVLGVAGGVGLIALIAVAQVLSRGD